MRRPIVAGNWKLHGSRTENARLVEEHHGAAPGEGPGSVHRLPAIRLSAGNRAILRGSSVQLGAQDVSQKRRALHRRSFRGAC